MQPSSGIDQAAGQFLLWVTWNEHRISFN